MSKLMSLTYAAIGAQVIQQIADERIRQIFDEKHDPDDDDIYATHRELPRAAAAYALYGRAEGGFSMWPWSIKFFKPKDERSNLIRAAALLVAEIERLDRAELAKIIEETKEGLKL